jgi:predicted transcriptional regulator
MSLVRVTCTLPADVLKAADTLAKRLDRSRSWVVAEALRAYPASAVEGESPRHATVAEPIRFPYDPAFEAARRSRREGDLRLSPSQRIHVAEELTETALKARRQPRLRQIVLLGSLEDYFKWKKRDVLW